MWALRVTSKSQILVISIRIFCILQRRECSIFQRRHQKVIEEASINVLPLRLEKAMGEAAVNVVALVIYVGAGTVEFC